MTEISIAEDLSVIEQLPAAAAREFATSCAQRVLPLIDTLASNTTSATVAEAMIWLEAPEEHTRYELERRIRSLEEASIDDSNDPRYYAMRALGILMDAIGASDAANAVAAARAACEGTVDLADDLDFILGAAGEETGVQAAERKAVGTVLTTLRSSGTTVSRSVDEGATNAAQLAFRRAAAHLLAAPAT